MKRRCKRCGAETENVFMCWDCYREALANSEGTSVRFQAPPPDDEATRPTFATIAEELNAAESKTAPDAS